MTHQTDYVDLPPGRGDEVETPPSLYAALERRWRFTWDAAATEANNCVANGFAGVDCLKEDWRELSGGGVVYLNPPYSEPFPYLSRAHHYSLEGVSTVALIKADHSTSWWNAFVDGHIVIPLRRRVRFYYLGRPLRHVAAFPSALVVYDGGLRSGEWR